LRGHGQSADAPFTFGIYERRDVEGAIDWLKSQGFESGKIGVLGVSMGAASVIGAAAGDRALMDNELYDNLTGR
jgi:alpha/beta superfamily hydrolase